MRLLASFGRLALGSLARLDCGGGLVVALVRRALDASTDRERGGGRDKERDK
jgi:hypothetical protein